MSNRSLKHRPGREPHLVLVPAHSTSADPLPDPATPEGFCAMLKAARERRGISLAAIAEETKIGSGLLASLERGSLSRWPGGIYRRAFFTAYVEAIGLPVEPTVAEFQRLFPEAESETTIAASAPPAAEPEPADAGRLSLAGTPRPIRSRRDALLVEAALVLLAAVVVGLLASLVSDAGIWTAALVVAGWYGRPVASALLRQLRLAQRRRA